MMRAAPRRMYQPPHLRLVQPEVINPIPGAAPGALDEGLGGMPKEIKAIIFCGVLMVLVALIDLVRMVAKPPGTIVAKYDQTIPRSVAKEARPADFPTSLASIPLLRRMFCVGLSVPQFCLDEQKEPTRTVTRTVPLSKTQQKRK